MRFQFTPIPSLPRLAWCALISKGNEIIQVHHGPWVETGETYFFEGAWDGEFEAVGFGDSMTLVGSGGLLQEEEPLFAAPTDMSVGLTSMRVEDTLLISNSTVFALVMAGDKPDINYPDYYFDIVHMRRWGLRRLSAAMPTHRASCFSIHQWENFVVSPDLRIRAQQKPRAPRPVYCPRVLGQWFDGIRFYAAASSPRRSRRTWAGLR